MSVELRIVVPYKIAEALRRKAEEEGVSVEEVVLLALAKVVEEESRGG